MSISSRLRRTAAALSLLTAVGAGLSVHALAPDIAASDIAGDALYALAAYAGVALLVPRLAPAVVAITAGGWCVAVELFQLTGLPLQWGGAFAPVTLLLGTVFDGRDLIVYVLAVLVAAGVDSVVGRRLLSGR